MTRFNSLRMGALAIVAAIALASCAAFDVKPQTFNEGVAACLSSATSARTLSFALLSADKISANDAENANKQADVLREGCDVADALKGSDIKSAQGKLDATRTALGALRGYLESRQ
jgi:hypothetical protein